MNVNGGASLLVKAAVSMLEARMNDPDRANGNSKPDSELKNLRDALLILGNVHVSDEKDGEEKNGETSAAPHSTISVYA